MAEIIQWQDYPDFAQILRLSGELFTLRARWNSVREFWTIDLADKNDAPILIGQKLVFGVEYFARYRDPRLPPGSLFMIDAGGANTETDRIGRNDIGTNAFLVYEA